MRSTLRILLIFIASLVACVYGADFAFNPVRLNEFRQDQLKRMIDRCDVISDGPQSDNYCYSFCRYKDVASNIRTFTSCSDQKGHIMTVNETFCNAHQQDLLMCIPECDHHHSKGNPCQYEILPGYNSSSNNILPPKEYLYRKGEFNVPYKRNISDEDGQKRTAQCTAAYANVTALDKCVSFCRYKTKNQDRSDEFHVFGENMTGKCDPKSDDVSQQEDAFCIYHQTELQKCIPECKKCSYQEKIPGFQLFDKLPDGQTFLLPYFHEIENRRHKMKECDAMYSGNRGKANKGQQCLAFCLYKETDNGNVYYLGSEARGTCDIMKGIRKIEKHNNGTEWCQHSQTLFLGECPHECRHDPDLCYATTTSTTTPTTTTVVTTTTTTKPENTRTTAETSTTTTPVQTTTTKNDPSPLVSSSKPQETLSTTAKVAPTTTKMTDFPGPIFSIPTYGPEPTDEEPKETTVDPRNNQRATDPGPSVDGDKKEEGGGPNLKFLWILLPVALLLLVGGGVAGFLVRRRLKARKSKGKSKTVEVEMGTLPPPPSMQTKKPPSRKRPYFKVSQVDETIPPREMPPGPITKKFKFEGALDLDATGTHGKTTHQLDGAKSHSLRDVMFSDQMNRVFDMGSQVENIIPSPPREGVGEGGGQGGQQQGQEGGGRQGEQGQQGGQGAEGAQSQGGQAPTDK